MKRRSTVTGGRFAHNAEDQVVYCAIEGVSWITPNRIIVGSDKTKMTQNKRRRDKTNRFTSSRSRS
jgi:hypothetical protein